MNYKIIKLFTVFFLLLSFQGCKEQVKVENQVQKTPNWYLENSSSSTIIYGYGSSNTIEDAKSKAREDIAKTIKVKIQSSLSMTTKTKKSSKFNSEDFTQQTQHSIDEYTNMILTNIKMNKHIQVNNTWFVRMSYTNLPIIQQIKKTFTSTKIKEMPESNPLINSNFSKNLKVSFGYSPNYTIFFKNDLFFLNIQNHNFILSINDIKKFFFSINNPNIKLISSKKQLKSGDYFHFDITHSNNGYISLIQIDEEGKIIVHLDNLTAKNIIYPNLEMFEGLQAGILNNKDTAVEMYLAVSCKEKTNFAIFEQIGLDFNKNIDALRFPNLYNLINKCNYSSLIMRTDR